MSMVTFDDMKDQLAMLIAEATYDWNQVTAQRKLREALDLEEEMLRLLGKIDEYQESLSYIRKEFDRGECITNIDAREGFRICCMAEDELIKIAIREKLISVSKDFYDCSRVTCEQVMVNV